MYRYSRSPDVYAKVYAFRMQEGIVTSTADNRQNCPVRAGIARQKMSPSSDVITLRRSPTRSFLHVTNRLSSPTPRGCLLLNPMPTTLLHTRLRRTSEIQNRLAIPMSTSNPTAGPSAGPSTDNFTAIFNAALNEYEKLTGKRLDTHPFAAQLESCQTPEAISNVLRTQAQAFSKFREGDEKLMAWLNPTIHILSTFSDTLGEGISLVSNLVHLHRTVLRRPVLRPSHLRKRSSLGSVFFSEYVFPKSLSCFRMTSKY